MGLTLKGVWKFLIEDIGIKHCLKVKKSYKVCVTGNSIK